MALTLGDRAIRPLTADEVMDMVRVGILHEDDRVQLLHGALIQMSPMKPPHAVCVQRLNAWLAPLMAAGTHDVRVQLPFSVPDPTSLPEPDVAVVDRDAGLGTHPSAAALIVEVADSSLRLDTTVKPALYASAGVPEYWVIDVNARRLHVRTAPTAGGYADEVVLGPGDHAQPRHVAAAPLDVAALLAGL